MNQKGGRSNYTIFIIIFLGLLTAISIILEIYLSTQETTNLELSLFSLMQFIFSVAFAWVLAKSQAKEEFYHSQKKFAYAAFRRISEIKSGIERIINRKNDDRINMVETSEFELNVIYEICIGIQAAIDSSIIDWEEVIGNEIETIEKIKSMRISYINKLDESQENISKSENANKALILAQKKLDEQTKSIDNLMKSLPLSLRSIVTKEPNDHQKIMESVKKLDEEYCENNYLILRAFWEDEYDENIHNYKKNDDVKIKIMTTKHRRGSLTVVNDEDKSIGGVYNKTNLSYSLFISAFFRYFGKSEIKGKIIEIENDKKSKRIQFKIKTSDVIEEHDN